MADINPYPGSLTMHVAYPPNPTPWHPWNDDIRGRVPAVVPGVVTVVCNGHRWTAPVLAYGRGTVVYILGKHFRDCGCALAIIDPNQGPQWWAPGEYEDVTVTITTETPSRAS